MKDKNAVLKVVLAAKAAAGAGAFAETKRKNAALDSLARGLLSSGASILKANALDLRRAEKARMDAAKLDRLKITPERLSAMAEGVRAVAKLPDPIGRVLERWKRPNGLRLSKISVPIGVVLIIYESRPNATVECGALCLKSGNAAILRGGSEASASNAAIGAVFERALGANGLPKALVSVLKTTERAAVDFLLTRDKEIGLVIPRGGESLIRAVAEKARMPVIKHYKGVCHVFVHRSADLKMAERIVLNAKLQRPGVCNAMECLLVDRTIAARFLPALGEKLRAGGCALRADAASRRHLKGASPAEPDDFGREFLDRILAVKTVDGVDGATRHIARFGSGHTDAIVARDHAASRRFAERVDSASVMINASTRFADGFEFGFGAEIGISTDKIHARGPMGLEGLTSYKYIVEGSGQIRV